MSDVDDDQGWLKIDPAAAEPDDESSSSEWVFIEEGDNWRNSSEEEEEDDDEDCDAFIQEEDDDLFFLQEPEQEEEEERKQFLEVIKQQVLPRLPAKSLLRMKSTSRQFDAYISSPLFIHTHSRLRRSLSGMFFHTPSGAPSFAAFDGDPSPLPDPSLSFLPEPVLVVASAGGLLCCRGRRTASYYVCNPMLISEWALLPPTLGRHGPDPAVALVMREPSAYNFCADYYVVCAYEVLEGVYAFESFSSASAEWRLSNEIAAAERVVSGSVVSAGGFAYWRTTMQSVLGYNPETDVSRTVFGPMVDGSGAAAWEIGELGRRLCCVSAEWGEAEVRVLLEDGGEPRWRKVEEFAAAAAAAWEGDVVPLRTQSDSEAVVWEGRSGAVVAHDLSTGSKRVLPDSAAAGYCADFLPYASTLVHVRRYDIPYHDQSTNESHKISDLDNSAVLPFRLIV